MSINELLAARKANLSLAQKRALLDKHQAQQEKTTQQRGPVISKRGNIQAALSAAQQRLWFEWLIDKNNTAYHLSGGMCFKGQLNAEALQSSLDNLVQRHASLRTQFFESDDGKPLQRVLPNINLSVDIVTARQLQSEMQTIQAQNTSEEVIRQQLLQSRLQQFAATPFDLRAGALMRMQWLQFTNDDNVLLVVIHHIISDAWSKSVIIGDFVEFYQSACVGQAVHHDANSLQYIDFAQWQNDWLLSSAQEVQQQWQFWQQEFNDELPIIELGNSPMTAPSQGKLFEECLDVSQASIVSQFAREQGMSLFVVLFSAFQALLYRYCGANELLTAVPVANRNQFANHNVVGFFVNMQLVRLPIDSGKTLAALLQQCAQKTQQVQNHQDIPIDALLKRFQPQLQGGAYQVMFNHLKDASGGLGKLTGLTLTDYFSLSQGSMCDLALDTTELPDGRVKLQWRYESNKLSSEWVATFSKHYQNVLKQFCQNPHIQLRDLHFLEAQQQTLLQQFSNAGCDEQAATDATPWHVLSAFNAHVSDTPDAVALRFSGGDVSYAQLQKRVEQLAHCLSTYNISYESKVALALDRSVDMVAAMLAVWQVGAAYVPIDPDLPKERMAYIYRHSSSEVLFSQSHLCAQLPDEMQTAALWLDKLNLDAQTASSVVVLQPTQLAYVIYTSGSTGNPKGVACTHQGLANRLIWGQQQYGLCKEDKVLQKTPFGFDVSIWEFFWPLSQGATLVLAAPQQHKDPAQIKLLIEREQVTVCHFVPSMLKVFLTHLDSLFIANGTQLCPSLRQLFTSGEALKPETQKQCLAKLGHAQLHNLYGPTETAIEVTAWHCQNNTEVIPIGTPISNVQAFVLDADLNPVPVGVAGELYLSGACLARGYLQRPDLSAERFVANPFVNNDGNQIGARMYRTGDQVCWNIKGQLLYLGRLDHQVKIRGFRIELAEIEVQIRQLANIRDAVVIAKPSANGEQLAAYLVLNTQQQHQDWAVDLAKKLPEYMIPSMFIVIEQLPTSANGKLDLRALPEPQWHATACYTAPQGDVETKLAVLWQQVLQVKRVGRNDHFFALGGHSLLLVELLSQVRQLFSVDISVRDAFAKPLLSDFAMLITEQSQVNSDESLHALAAFMEDL